MVHPPRQVDGVLPRRGPARPEAAGQGVALAGQHYIAGFLFYCALYPNRRKRSTANANALIGADHLALVLQPDLSS